MAALPQPIDADARLESMTSALLEVTSVFLIQQNELQEVRERLQKELARVAQIQDALTQAAQKHQDAVSRARREQGSTFQPCIGPLLARSHALPFIVNAQRGHASSLHALFFTAFQTSQVLSAVQSYESLSVAHEAALAQAQSVFRQVSGASGGHDGTMPPGAGAGIATPRHSASAHVPPPPPHTPAPPFGLDGASLRQGAGAQRDSRRSQRAVALPPVSSELHVFKPAAKPAKGRAEDSRAGGELSGGEEEEDDEGGIEYVANLQVVGGVLGTMMKASGEFVGTPTIQWSRLAHKRGGPVFVEIPGATSLEYFPSADDVGTRIKVDATGPYGGETVTIETSVIALDPNTHEMLQDKLRRGHAEFSCVTEEGNEQRILLITRKNIKVRNRLSSVVQSAKTLYKQVRCSRRTAAHGAPRTQRTPKRPVPPLSACLPHADLAVVFRSNPTAALRGTTCPSRARRAPPPTVASSCASVRTRSNS